MQCCLTKRHYPSLAFIDSAEPLPGDGLSPSSEDKIWQFVEKAHYGPICFVPISFFFSVPTQSLLSLLII